MIKSRNRVKSSAQSQKRKVDCLLKTLSLHVSNLELQSQPDATAISAIRSDAGTPPVHHGPPHNGQASDRSNSPISRINTPSLHHDPNIAPQHLFDGAVNLTSEPYHPSPSLPALHLSHPSPGSTPSLNGRHLEPPLTYEDLHRENEKLKTRVSELEVIHLLTKQDLDNARASEEELKRRISDLENRMHERDAGPPTKKLRLSDVVQDD